MTIRDDALLIAGYALALKADPHPSIEAAISRVISYVDDKNVADINMQRIVQNLNTSPERVQEKPKIEHVEATIEDVLTSELHNAVDPLPEKKQRKPWSDEAKAAARDRLKARIAAGTFKPASGKAKLIDEPAPPRIDTPPDRLIEDHKDFIGQRDDRILLDSDWGDIQKMRYNGLPDTRIAKSYSVTEEYLLNFIKIMEAKDAAKSGNF